MDNIDAQYMRQLADEAREQREKELKSAGPLLDDITRNLVEDFIMRETLLPKDDVVAIVDIINHYAGKDDTPIKQTIKEALESHIKKPAFVKRVANELENTITKAVNERSNRIEEQKQQDVKPVVKTNSPTLPKQGM